MPLIRIELLKGQSSEYKQSLSEIIHKAMVECFNVPQNDRRQIMYEHEKQNFEYSPKSENFIFIEVILMKGRSLNAKRAFYQQVVSNIASNLLIDKDDITIVLNEQPLENWGIKGGLPASDFNFNFV